MYDVIIIGSGAAGLSAALSAKEKNSKTLVISKTQPTHSQTVQAQGGINAVLYEDKDSIEQHVSDTYNASKEISSKDNINFMCSNAKDTINWLDEIGVPFNRDEENKISQRKFGGTKKIRTCYSSDYTGLKILHTLFDQCIKNKIEFLNEHVLLDLIVENKICKGVVILDILSGEIKEIYSKSIILATGGYAGIYQNFTTNSYSNTADGIAIALRAGAKLSNMEFIQFHPTALVNSNILISESARGEGGYLVDKDGNRFIDELKARDEVARAIYTKITNKENVYLDLRHLGLEKINDLMPQERRLALEFSNVKLEEELLPINPAAHYTMGGIKTNINGQTNIKNLYACGECAQANIHGANRLGGNSLLEIVTLGKHIGNYVSENIDNQTIVQDMNSSKLELIKEEIKNIFEYKNEINLYKCKDKVGQILFDKAGLFKDENSLNEALNQINEIKNSLDKIGVVDKQKEYNKNLLEFLEFRNIIDIALVVIESALNREESRGSHYRVDFPNIDVSYLKNSKAVLKENKVSCSFEDVV